MTREIIDDRLIGALHLRALSREGLAHNPVEEHRAIQAGTLDALMAGGYDGDTTLGEVLRLGNFGIGTIQHLGGEMIILDSEPWLVDADGVVTRIARTTKTPFAVVCTFTAARTVAVPEGECLDSLLDLIDAAAPVRTPIVAVRVHGRFSDLALRSVRRQVPPYPPLSEVVHSQTHFAINDAVGTLVGFRFPDATAGLEVPGYHLHFLSDDRSCGGHVMGLTTAGAVAEIDHCKELHIELPPGVTLGTPGGVTRADIDAVEGRHGTVGDDDAAK